MIEILIVKLITYAIPIIPVISNNKTNDRRKKHKKFERLINFVVTIFNRFYKFHDKIRINRIKYLPRNWEITCTGNIFCQDDFR